MQNGGPSHTLGTRDDGDGDVQLFDPSSVQVAKSTKRLDFESHEISKNGFAHFMLKEMMEIPETIENTLRGRLLPKEGDVKLGGLREVLPDLARGLIPDPPVDITHILPIV